MAEKNLAPTPKKIQDTHRKGEVAYSADVAQLATLAASVVYLSLSGAVLFERLRTIAGAGTLAFSGGAFGQRLGALGAQLGWLALDALAPLLASICLASVSAELLQIGPLWAPARIRPSFAKLNPLTEIKSLVSVASLVDFGKTLLKAALVAGAAWSAAHRFLPDVMRLGGAMPGALLDVLGALLKRMTWLALLMLVPVMLADLFWQRRLLLKKIRMSTEDVRREYKENEGAPEVRQRRKQSHHELLSDEVKKNVQRSSVIVTNPVHLAVGLRYKAGETPLPKITLMMRAAAARAVREYATREGIPVVENVPLARALFADARVGQYIPPGCIDAVAAIIAALRQMQAPTAAPGDSPGPSE